MTVYSDYLTNIYKLISVFLQASIKLVKVYRQTTTITRGFNNSDGTWVHLASTQVKVHCLQVTQIKQN